MIVDDSPAMRGVIRRVIELSGFDLEKCLEAGNGEQALGVLKAQWVDLILTDINMPVMNGEELLNRLHGDELLNSIPVVVISTDASQHRIGRMLGLGAKGYVAKPFFPQMLRGELERVLEVSNA